MTDNRTNELTEAQIERAAAAMQAESSGFFSIEAWRHLARVGLTAAGVAPQPACLNCDEPVAESDLKANYVGRGYVHQVKCPQVPNQNETSDADLLDVLLSEPITAKGFDDQVRKRRDRIIRAGFARRSQW